MKICVFYCSNSLTREDLSRFLDTAEGYEFNTISLPCSGKVNIPYLVKAFETGAECVVILTCHQGQCHNLEGNIRAHKRSQAVGSLLEEIGMSKDRITVIEISEDGIESAIEEIKTYCDKIRKSAGLKSEAVSS